MKSRKFDRHFNALFKDLSCRRDIPGDFKVIHAAIVDRIGSSNGKCWPSMAKIAKDAGTSEKTVFTAIRRLEDEGYLIVTKRGCNRVHHYSIPDKSTVKFTDQTTVKFTDQPVKFTDQLRKNLRTNHTTADSMNHTTAEETVVDHAVYSLLQKHHITGSKLTELATNPNITVDQVEATWEEAKTKDKPTGFLVWALENGIVDFTRPIDTPAELAQAKHNAEVLKEIA